MMSVRHLDKSSKLLDVTLGSRSLGYIYMADDFSYVVPFSSQNA
jgi:hypothetical protein